MSKTFRKTRSNNTRKFAYLFRKNRTSIFLFGIFIFLIFFLGLFFQKRFSTKSRAESTDSYNTIIGGRDADPADWGFFVRTISVNKSNGTVTPCGGSLISPEWVLTAAHCVRYYHQGQKGSSQGEYLYLRVLRKENGVRFLSRRVLKTYIPEGYFDNGRDDIALIQLENSEKYDEEIISLPSRSLFFPENAVLKTSGYGVSTITWNEKEFKDNMSYPGNLKEVELHFSEFSADKTRLIPIENTIGTCYGDSGGPLIYTDFSGNNYIVGTTMGGVPGCQSTRWFANVQNYLDWITEVTGIPTP